MAGRITSWSLRGRGLRLVPRQFRRCLTTEASVSDLKLSEKVASRGNNLVLLAPPVPSLARPLLAGVLARLQEATAARGLALAPPAALEEWVEVAAEAARATGQRV